MKLTTLCVEKDPKPWAGFQKSARVIMTALVILEMKLVGVCVDLILMDLLTVLFILLMNPWSVGGKLKEIESINWRFIGSLFVSITLICKGRLIAAWEMCGGIIMSIRRENRKLIAALLRLEFWLWGVIF